jgi:hypothetical protein
MTLSANFTDQITYSMDFVEFTNDAVIVVAKETGELGWKRFEFLFGGTFRRLFTFSLESALAVKEVDHLGLSLL